MKELAGQLRSQRVTGSSGGGMIGVEANGIGEVLKVSIDPQLTDREMIEDLLPAAINQALAKAKELHVEMVKSVTGDLNVPGLSEALSEFTGDVT